jgi:hypothetical protein
MTNSEIQAAIEANEEFVEIEEGKVQSEFVKAVPRLKGDVLALTKLTTDEAPPKVIKRRVKSGLVCYSFGDASGQGFGNAIKINGMSYTEYSTWSRELEHKHSNYKELHNLVNAIKKAYASDLLKNTEIFLFTDNFVAECTFYNGGLNINKDLNDIVFELWQLQMKGDFTLHVFHITGTQMIESGIDGLSRGDKLEGIGKGESVNNFVPIHLALLIRSKYIKPWMNSWWPGEEMGVLKFMTPKDWFADSMSPGNFLWNIAPAARQVAVK